MKITEIYEKYKIMPQLQMHMLRVAAVSAMICDNFDKPVNKDTIIQACLLHDMGNILKTFLFPDFIKGPKYDHWVSIRNKFVENYGKDPDIATVKICYEISVPKQIVDIITNIGYKNFKKLIKINNFDYNIVQYSDMRVAPNGVSSLAKRIADGIERYQPVETRDKLKGQKIQDIWVDHLIRIEKQIFSHCKIRPEDITEEKALLIIEKLRDFEIITGK